MVTVLIWMQAGKPVTQEALKDIKAPALQSTVPAAMPSSAAPVVRPGVLPALQPPVGQPGSLPNPSKALGAVGQPPLHLRARCFGACPGERADHPFASPAALTIICTGH